MNDNDTISRKALLAQYDAEHQGPPGRERELIVNAPPVPQEMSAREFIRTYYKMCEDVYLHDCTGCPLRTAADSAKVSCEGFLRGYPDEAAEIVEQWAKDHPEKKRKTYAEDFKEHFGREWNASHGNWQCRNKLYFDTYCDNHTSCTACWNEEMEDDK